MVELTSADDLAQTPVWTLRHGGHAAPRKKRSQKMMQSIWRDAVGTSRRLLGIGRLAAIALPFVSSAKTPLTGQVTTGREFVTARVSMERVDRIRKRKRTRSTLNHVALTCLDGATRRYLSDQGVGLR